MCLGVSISISVYSDKTDRTLFIALKLTEVSRFKTITICIINVENEYNSGRDLEDKSSTELIIFFYLLQFFSIFVSFNLH